MSLPEKHIHVDTPGSYKRVLLNDYCITPSKDQTLLFDVMTRNDAIEVLVEESSPYYYEVVIGAYNNRRGYIRKRKERDIGNKKMKYIRKYSTLKSEKKVTYVNSKDLIYYND